jgi:hypothetical protein
MRVMGFNGLGCHFEMYTYVIDYCVIKHGWDLTIYHKGYEASELDVDTFYLDWVARKKKETCEDVSSGQFSGKRCGNFRFKFLWDDFEKEVNHYDAYVLFTDDDGEFSVWDNRYILDRTMMIEHFMFRRRFDVPTNQCISTRPFVFSERMTRYARKYSKFREDTIVDWSIFASDRWALPVFCGVRERGGEVGGRRGTRQEIHVGILGASAKSLSQERIRRLVFGAMLPVKLHLISRLKINVGDFWGLSDLVESGRLSIETLFNATMEELYEKVENVCDFLMTDVATDNGDFNSECVLMSGTIPAAISTLTPLIISRETNAYYRFPEDAVVQFSKWDCSPILLRPISDDAVLKLRQDMLDRRDREFDAIFKNILLN